MTAIPFPQKAPAPSRAAGRLLAYAGALAAAYIALNAGFPELARTGIPSAVVRLVTHAALLAGLWLGLSRTAFRRPDRIRLWLVAAGALTLWLAIVWTLALDGRFQPGLSRVPALPIAVLVPLLLLLPPLLRSRRVGALLDATPPSWLVGVQLYRVLGGTFLVGWATGAAPGIFALPAGTGDLAVGLLALPAAAYHASGEGAGRSAAIAWNLLGLLDLAVAIAMGAMTAPGPLQHFAFDHPNLLVGTYPSVLIPAFTVPLSIVLHALSLRQLVRRKAPAPSRLIADGSTP